MASVLELETNLGEVLSFTITEKAPSRAFFWLKVPISTFTFKTLLFRGCLVRVFTVHLISICIVVLMVLLNCRLWRWGWQMSGALISGYDGRCLQCPGCALCVCSYQSVLGGSTVTFMQSVLTFAKFKVSQSRRLKGHDVTFQAASIFGGALFFLD